MDHLLRTEEYKRLTEHQAYIRENMTSDFMAGATDMLYQEQLLSSTEHQNFEEIQLSSKKADNLFRLLITGTSYRYNTFLDFCKEEHPEMHDKLYISDYNAEVPSALGKDAANASGSGVVIAQPTSPEAVTTSRCYSPPAALLNLDEQSPVMDVKVVPVFSAHIKSKFSRSKTVYASSYPVRGVAMLFVNVHFSDSSFPTRTGANHDQTNLSNLFHQLNYNVKVFQNLTKDEVLKELNDQKRNPAHKDFGSFILGFSTHWANEKKAIACSDGKSLHIDVICEQFDSSSCPYLAGKPKFIFFDASLGHAHDRAVPVDKGLDAPRVFEPVKKQLADIGFSLANIQLGNQRRIDVPTRDLVPSNIAQSNVTNAHTLVADKSDFIIALSTFDGYVSWRRNSHGCWFSRIMVEVFQRYACDTHLVELLKLVRRKLSYVETKEGYKQVNTTTDTSLKHFYFFPGMPV